MTSSSILVGVDFTASSHRAVEEAQRVARRLGARLFMVYVLVPPPPEFGPLDLEVADTARQALAAMAAAAVSNGIDAVAHVRIGGAVTGLLAVIRQIQPSVVVLGRCSNRLTGKVAEGLARRSPAPILVVPASAAPVERAA